MREDSADHHHNYRFYDVPKDLKTTKSLEDKIDVMWEEISKLKKKSEQLEN